MLLNKLSELQELEQKKYGPECELRIILYTEGYILEFKNSNQSNWASSQFFPMTESDMLNMLDKLIEVYKKD